jgi:putative endonuclease
MLSRIMFGLVQAGARKGLVGAPGAGNARQTGIRGETYAYWYLRRQRYVIVARNYTAAGMKGEIDLVGYDGSVLAFIEVKTRFADDDAPGRPEQAITPEKRRNLGRMARKFLAERRMAGTPYRFDVLAIESLPGSPPEVRLHKGAFAEN